TSLGVGFHRLSYRALAGAGVEPPQEAAKVGEPRGRRRRRGGRRGRREGAAPAPSLPISPAAHGGEPAGEAHTAPHDELLAGAGGDRLAVGQSARESWSRRSGGRRDSS